MSNIILRSHGGQVDGDIALNNNGASAQHESGGSTATVNVDPEGAGTFVDGQHESGGSTATVNVDPEGAGTFVDEPPGQHESGGSTATINVDPEGTGTALEAASGGSTASVTVDVEAGGTSVDLFLIVAVQDGGDVDLSWAAQPSATGYAIERDGTIIAWDVQTATFTDLAPAEGEHTYRVGVIA